MSKTANRVVKFLLMSEWPNQNGQDQKTFPSRKMYLCCCDLGPLIATITVLDCVSSVFCCCWFHVFSVLFNITHENGPTGTKRRVRASVLGTAALFTQQLYIETEFARNTQTFEKLEHFSDHHVLGRIEITHFQTLTSGDFRIALYPRYFFRTY